MNMTNQYKILALDLDGTLLDAQSRITPENARAVRMAQQAGVQIVLCTGRNVREVRRFSEQLEAAPDWLVTANGAAVQHPDDREPAFFDGLSTEMVDVILNECTAIDTDPCLYTTQDLYYGHAFRHFLENLQRRGRVVMDEADKGYHFVGDKNAWRAVLADEPRPFTKAILYHDDPNAIAPLTAALDKYGIFELAPSVMYGGELRNVEVNRVGVHKGRGLEWLAHHLGCTLANVIAIGDSENDRSDHAADGGAGRCHGKQRAVHPRSSGRYHRQQYGKRCRTGDLPTYSGRMNDEKSSGNRRTAH